ncbi:mucin-associated surface protein (MASP), putative [Trypanosoma cruzi marinkellei]|uniref:Mucin-associated surface protein (MASP), putative n=1 Tax=Trypanosoma cruzi marinkellei TaxID=85056 RepID=K2MYU5_TRYCR|nr:mucin-associated surface protein (MASP), putative [Trypanosoma cruzi marinkellei]
MMAMMMTGRVLLVCALCVLWCVIATVVAMPAADVAEGDGSADEYLTSQRHAQLRRDCVENVGRRTGGRVNASAVEECVREGMDGVRAVADGRSRWGRHQFAVAAADGPSKDDSTPESSPQDQTGSGAGLTGGQQLKPSLNSDPGISDKATAEKETLTRPPEAPELVNNRTEEILKDQREEKKYNENPMEEENEDESNDNREDDNSITKSSEDDEEDEEEVLEAGSNNKEERVGVNVDSDEFLKDHAVVQLAVPVDVARQERSLTLNNAGTGGKGGAGETTVLEGEENKSAKLTHKTGADLMQTETLKEGKDQTGAGNQQAIDGAQSNEAAPPATKEEMTKEAPKQAKKATAHNNVNRKETTEKGKNGAEGEKEEYSDKAGKEEKNMEEKKVEEANKEKGETGRETAAKGEEAATTTKTTAKLKESVEEKMAAVKSHKMNDTTTTGDSDSSSAVSHTTSPLLLLVVAAAAAVVAA